MFSLSKLFSLFSKSKPNPLTGIEPKARDERLMEWRSRQTRTYAAENPVKAYYDLMDQLSDQADVLAGLQNASRFDSRKAKLALRRAENQAQDIINLLHDLRPSEYVIQRDEDVALEQQQLSQTLFQNSLAVRNLMGTHRYDSPENHKRLVAADNRILNAMHCLDSLEPRVMPENEVSHITHEEATSDNAATV